MIIVLTVASVCTNRFRSHCCNNFSNNDLKTCVLPSSSTKSYIHGQAQTVKNTQKAVLTFAATLNYFMFCSAFLGLATVYRHVLTKTAVSIIKWTQNFGWKFEGNRPEQYEEKYQKSSKKVFWKQDVWIQLASTSLSTIGFSRTPPWSYLS